MNKIKKNPSLLKDADFREDVAKTAISVKEIREMLQGIKSYIVAVLAAIVSVLYATGQITHELFESLMGLLAAGAVGAVAAKINRLGYRM